MRKLLATLLLTAGLVSTALAEDEEPEITVESGVIEIRAPGGRDLPIAVPKPKGSSAANRAGLEMVLTTQARGAALMKSRTGA